MGKRLNIGANRRAKKYSLKEYCYRCLWSFGSVIFRVTPRPCFLLRRVILRVFGATIGKAVNIYPSTNIMFPWNLQVGDYSCLGERVQVYNLGNLKIGENSTISQNSHLCGGTHNYKDASMPLIKSRILIGNDVWIGQNVTINRGVEIGNGAVVAAFSVVTKSIPPFEIWGGNPAKKIKDRFPEKVKQSLMELEWWKYDFGQFQDLDLRDVEGFIRVLNEDSGRFVVFSPDKITVSDIANNLAT